MFPAKYHPLLGGLVALLLLWLPLAAHAADRGDDPDQELLRQAKVGSDAASLLEFLRSHSLADASPQRVEQLIRRLGSSNFEERTQVAKDLVASGRLALGPLREALKSDDREVVRRAQSCIEEIERLDSVPGLELAVVRVLVRLRPAGTVETLLRYLPCANEEGLEAEIWYGLDALGAPEGKVDPALPAALGDASPSRQAAAGCIVGHRGDTDQRAAVRKLLDDPVPLVRLRAAQGLLAAKDKAAVPVLIAMLDQPSVELSWQAEELLHWIAGDDAPEPVIGAASPDARQRCRTAWKAWWRQQEAKLDLDKLDQDCRRPGLVLVCEWVMGFVGGNVPGRIYVCGCDGKPRWQLDGLSEPWDAQLLSGNRVLIGEFVPPRVSERDLSGKVVWQNDMGGILFRSCRRLANGNTCVVHPSPLRVIELTPQGKEARRREFLGVNLQFDGVKRLENGHILCLADPGQVQSVAEFDPEPVIGREVKRVQLQNPLQVNRVYRVEPVPGGHYLITGSMEGPAEVDNTGKTVWKGPRTGTHAVRLRNGNTLVGRAGPAEYDPAGRLVWEAPREDGAMYVSACLDLVRVGFDGPRPAGFDLAASIPYQLKRLSSKDVLLRRRAGEALEVLGPKAAAAVPALLEALDDPEEKVRSDAEGALGKVLTAETLPGLLKAAKDKRLNVRKWAVYLLWKFGDQSEQVVPVLLEALRDDNPVVRREAAFAVRHHAKRAEEIVPALISALKDKDLPTSRKQMTVAENAAQSLRFLGAAAKPAIPALFEMCNAEDERLRACAFDALAGIAAKDTNARATVLPMLLRTLKDKDLRSRGDAISGLTTLGPEAKEAVPALREALQVKDVPDPAEAKRIRAGVLYALCRIGPGAREAIPDLTAIMQDKQLDPSERQRAAEALGNIGPEAKSAAPVLTEALQDKDYRVREAAAKALEKIQH